MKFRVLQLRGEFHDKQNLKYTFVNVQICMSSSLKDFKREHYSIEKMKNDIISQSDGENSMATISQEEENYVRMSLLLFGIAPRAVRAKFDSEFAPACLDASLKAAHNILTDLKTKRIINQSQWNLLFPYNGCPDSKMFDVTLMITLLINLAKLKHYNSLPFETDTIPSADLGRIKYYRNHISHNKDGTIDNTFFSTAWEDILEAVQRLGGITMKQECDRLMTRPLDMSSQEMLRDLQQAKNDITIIKHTLGSIQFDYTKDIEKDRTKSKNDIQKLTIIYDRLHLSNKMLQEEQAASKHSMDELWSDHKNLQNNCDLFHKKQTEFQNDIVKLEAGYTSLQKSQEDTVPWNRREYIKSELEEWKKGIDNFIKTRAAKHALKCIQENSCVTIAASSGVGKTATLRQVALEMETEGYDILPLSDPKEIVQFSNPNQKTLFVIDNFCGTYSLNQTELESWEPVMDQIKRRIENKLTKIIVACRLQVFKDEKFESLSIFRKSVCNLSTHLYLSNTEKQSIAELYLKTKASEIMQYCDLHDCFPLLCKLYSVNPELNIKDFFQNPFFVYEAEIDNLLRKGHFKKYCALALCVMFDNRLEEKWLTDEIDTETRRIIENTCETCRLERGTSRLILLDEIRSLEHTYLKKEQNLYTTLHDKLFDILTFYFGNKMIQCLIRNAVSHLIMQRFLIYKQDDNNQQIILVPHDYHQMYIQRMIDDWNKGRVRCVFHNINMKIPKFRDRFLTYLKTLDILFQRQLALTCDADCKDTVMLHCCLLNDVSLIMWSIDYAVNINQCNCDGVSPLMVASVTGNAEVIKQLLDRKADINRCSHTGESPLLMACTKNRAGIVKLLIDNKADINQCRDNEISPLSVACEKNCVQTVKVLVENKADINKCTNNGESPLIIACNNNHIEIVKFLLDNKADINTCTYAGASPLLIACQKTHMEVVKVLLDNKADINKCLDDGTSPLYLASQVNNTEIVKMLLDNEADINTCIHTGASPLYIACQTNRIETVKLLLENKADINKSVNFGVSPLFVACLYNNKEIVKVLLDNKADIDKCTDNGESPLFAVCRKNLTEIAKILIDYKADINKCTDKKETPLFIACMKNHIEITKLLLENKADVNKCNDVEKTPLMCACDENYKQIIELLLNNNAEVNTSSRSGVSPLVIASFNNNIDIVRMLLKKGASYDKIDPVYRMACYALGIQEKVYMDEPLD